MTSVTITCPECGRDSDVHSDYKGDYYGCEHVRRRSLENKRLDKLERRR